MIRYLVPNLPSTDAIVPYLREIDQNRWYSNSGPLHCRFQQQLGDHFFPNIRMEQQATLTSSATLGIQLALQSLKLAEKSLVLTSTYTYPATGLAILNAGLTPLLSPPSSNWQLTPKHAYRYLEQYPISAIIPIASAGLPVDTDGWDQFQRDTGIPVIVDAAAALGNQSPGQHITTVYSLHATKPYGIGEGGLVIDPSSERSQFIASLRNLGYHEGIIQRCGTNAKLSEYHAAVGLAQLQRLPWLKQRQRRLRDRYLTGLQALPYSLQRDVKQHLPASLLIDLGSQDKRDQLQSYLQQQNIETRPLYLPMLHEHPLFHKNARTTTDLASKSVAMSGILALPYHTHLDTKDIDQVCEHLQHFSELSPHAKVNTP